MTPWTVALPGSSVHGISQARILVWVAISFSSILPFSVVQLLSHVRLFATHELQYARLPCVYHLLELGQTRVYQVDDAN